MVINPLSYPDPLPPEMRQATNFLPLERGGLRWG